VTSRTNPIVSCLHGGGRRQRNACLLGTVPRHLELPNANNLATLPIPYSICTSWQRRIINGSNPAIEPKNLHRTRLPLVPPNIDDHDGRGTRRFSYLVLCESMSSLLHYFVLVMRGGLDDVSKRRRGRRGESLGGFKRATRGKVPTLVCEACDFCGRPLRGGFCRVYFLPVARAVGSTRE
jgi:hypothetical protein